MKVTIVIPTFNRRDYVSQAIESVLLQQTSAELEIVVVDDGSTDDTRSIVESFGKYVKYIWTENGGVAHARNIGMRAAQGEFIAWLDSDDLYYPYKIELQARFLDAFPDVGMVYTEFSAFDQNGVFDESHLKSYHLAAYKQKANTYENIFAEKTNLKDAGLCLPGLQNNNVYQGNIFDKYLNDTFVFTNSIMFRRDLLDTVGYQDSSFHLYHDLEFVLRICRHFKVGFIDIPTYSLRYHENQISETGRESLRVTIERYKNLLEIVTRHGRNDLEYYRQHKKSVDRRMAVFHTEIALLMLGKGKQPEEARRHLEESNNCGCPKNFLWYISFIPAILRRAILKTRSWRDKAH